MWQHLGAFALTGVLLMLAFPRPGWGLLAYVALVPAAVAAGRTRNWRTLWWTGWVVLGLWWLWMLRWLLPISPAAPPALGVWLGLNAVAGVLAAGVLNQKLRWPMVVALPLGWVSIEALRSVWPVGGISWFTLAHSQAMWDTGDIGRVVQTADLLGQHTVGLVVAAVNGAVVDVLLRRKLPRTSVGLAGVLLVGAFVYGQWRIGEWAGATEAGPTVAVVQTHREQDNTVGLTAERVVEEWSDLVSLHGQAVQEKDGQRPTLVVWPETIVPAPLNPAGIARMREVAGNPEMTVDTRNWYGLRAQFGDVVPEVVQAGGVATIVGASGLEISPELRRTNAAYLVAPDGAIETTAYEKQHRVPMGEYIPGPGFVEDLIAWMSPWESSYVLTPGAGPVVFTLPGGWQVGTPICYEDAIAGVCREMVYGPDGKRMDFLVNLTNDGWYPGKGMRRQHAQLASLRCIENRVPMARSVNTGISTLIDSVGRSSARLDEYEAGVITHTLRVDNRSTVYGAVGGWPWALFVLLTAMAAAFAAVFGRPVAKHRIA
ncbi:MAG: apolipoprotein N-acyltransferase [Planctomycetota bacterium]